MLCNVCGLVLMMELKIGDDGAEKNVGLRGNFGG